MCQKAPIIITPLDRSASMVQGVPQGDPSSISEGKSVMTLMRPKKNALRSSQILSLHNIQWSGLIRRLISSVKSFSQNILYSKRTVYCQDNNHVTCPFHQCCLLPTWRLSPLRWLTASWCQTMVINSLFVSLLVSLNASVFASRFYQLCDTQSLPLLSSNA